jgi:hypothetical protein
VEQGPQQGNRQICSLNSSLKNNKLKIQATLEKAQCLARAAFFPEAKKKRKSKLHKARKQNPKGQTKMTSFFQSDQENPAIQTRFWSCKRKRLPPPKKGKEKWIAADREAFGVARKAE